MDWINPIDFLWLFHRIDIGDVDHHRLVVGSHQHAFEHVLGIGIDFLVRHKGWYLDEVASAGFRDIFEPVAPTHARLAANDKDYAFERTMVMHAGLGIGLDRDGAGPDLLGADTRMIDGRLPIHAGSLGRIVIELVPLDDANAVMFPPVLCVVVVMTVMMRVIRHAGRRFLASGPHQVLDRLARI